MDVGPELQPLADTVAPFFAKLNILVGGLFGIYAILLVARVWYERKKVKLLELILYDLDHQNMRDGIHYSSQKPTILHRVWQKINGWYHHWDSSIYIKRQARSKKKLKK